MSNILKDFIEMQAENYKLRSRLNSAEIKLKRLEAAEKELAAMREQEPVGTFIQWDTGDEDTGPELEWVESTSKEAIPLYRQPVPLAPVAVPDVIDAIIDEVLSVDTIASTSLIKALFHMKTGEMRLNSGSKPFVVSLP